jgi:hypothetical protein
VQFVSVLASHHHTGPPTPNTRDRALRTRLASSIKPNSWTDTLVHDAPYAFSIVRTQGMGRGTLFPWPPPPERQDEATGVRAHELPYGVSAGRHREGRDGNFVILREAGEA